MDLLHEEALRLRPTEIKSSATFWPEFTKTLEFLNDLQTKKPENRIGEVIYAGEENFKFKDYDVISWRSL